MKTMCDYTALDQAYSWFNEHLFEGGLPEVLITFRADKSAHGYFLENAVRTKDNSQGARHELAMNLNSNERDDETVLSTLVHEQAHVWQEEYGSPPKGNYHNREWAKKMKALGLPPHNLKDPNKETGVGVTHSIEEGGRFDLAAKALLATGWKLTWFEPEQPSLQTALRRAAQRKWVYICDGCGMRVWGKPGLDIACMNCSSFEEPIEIVRLVTEEETDE